MTKKERSERARKAAKASAVVRQMKSQEKERLKANDRR